MKKIQALAMGIVGGAALMFSSCNYLDIDDYTQGMFKEDSIFHSKKNADAYLWNTPTRFPDPGAIWGNSWNPGESASDEIVMRWKTPEFWGAQYTVGDINESNLSGNAISVWKNMYQIIFRCNKMLENYTKPEDMNDIDRRTYLGYIHFMRGYAYYHLLMNWGPIIMVGDKPLSTGESAEYYNRERMTYDESVDYICNEFAESLKGIPSPENNGINYYTRPTKGAALALIARLRLYQASPLFNGGDAARKCFANWKRKSDGKNYVSQVEDPRRWAVAAAAAKQVIDMGYYELHTVPLDNTIPAYPLADNVPTAPFPEGAGKIDPFHSFADMFNGESVMQIVKEFIWVQPSSNVSNYTRHCFPVKFGGWGGIAVPQRVVDCFLMKDGRTIHNASDKYPYSADLSQTADPETLGSYSIKSSVPKMYHNRSARFYASIGFPGRLWPMSSASSDGNYVNKQFWYSKDDQDAGKAGAGKNINDYNVSGYTSVKYIHPDDSWANGIGNVKSAFITSPKPFPIIRYAEVLLEYCEALNHVQGDEEVETTSISGEPITVTVSRDVNEIQKAFNPIRYRVGLPGLTAQDVADEETLDKVIKNERQVELFNEGYRYFDTRRWGTYLEEDANSENWRGLDVNKDRTDANGNGGFWNIVTINEQNIRDRVAKPKMVLLPIPHAEMLKVPNADQNPGWDR